MYPFSLVHKHFKFIGDFNFSGFAFCFIADVDCCRAHDILGLALSTSVRIKRNVKSTLIQARRRLMGQKWSKQLF